MPKAWDTTPKAGVFIFLIKLIEVGRPTLNVGSTMSLGNEVSRMRVKKKLRRSTAGWAVGIDGARGKTSHLTLSSVVPSLSEKRHSPNGPDAQKRWHHDRKERSHMSGGVT